MRYGEESDSMGNSHGLTHSHWNAHARQWRSIGSPLRPCAEDVRLMTHASLAGGACRILLLGVTPEIVEFPWPVGAHITAADLHISMIRSIWPGNNARREVVCADWLSLPFACDQFDIVIGDGCLTLLNYPDQYRELSRSIYRVLAPSGIWVTRQFCRPPKAESVKAVSEALWSGNIGSVHTLKWRIAMALHADKCERGVMLDDIWRAYRHVAPNPHHLTNLFGWNPHEVATLDNYQGSSSRYTFPTPDEIAGAMPEFNVQMVGCGAYELAERCPILSLSPVSIS